MEIAGRRLEKPRASSTSPLCRSKPKRFSTSRAGSRSWPRSESADYSFSGDPMLFRLRTQIADLALKHRLPSVSPYREGADAGGLIAYGVNIPGTFRHAAQYVD